jgi:hypothetical protein
VKQLFVGSESDALWSESCNTVESSLNPLTLHLQHAKQKFSLSKLLSQVWMLCNQMRVWRSVFESDWKLLFFSPSFEWTRNPVNEIRRKYPVILHRPDYRDQVYSEVLYAVPISNFAVLPTPHCKAQYFLCGADHLNPLNAELNPICHLLALLGAHHIFHVSMIRVNVCFVFRYTWPLSLFHKQ